MVTPETLAAAWRVAQHGAHHAMLAARTRQPALPDGGGSATDRARPGITLADSPAAGPAFSPNLAASPAPADPA